MYLCFARGRFLYEARPDLFPEGYLTRTEIGLWSRFYSEKKPRSENPWRILKK